MAAAARLIKPDVQLYHAAFHSGSLECAQSTAGGEQKRQWAERVPPNSASRAVRVRTAAAECRLSPDCVGKHQGPKRKRLSGAPGAHKSAAGYTALAGPGAKGQSAAVNPAPSHPHLHQQKYTQSHPGPVRHCVVLFFVFFSQIAAVCFSHFGGSRLK